MEEFALIFLIGVLFAFGWMCGRSSHQQDVKAEIRRHTFASHRTLADLPTDELIGILEFARTGVRPINL